MVNIIRFICDIYQPSFYVKIYPCQYSLLSNCYAILHCSSKEEGVSFDAIQFHLKAFSKVAIKYCNNIHNFAREKSKEQSFFVASMLYKLSHLII